MDYLVNSLVISGEIGTSLESSTILHDILSLEAGVVNRVSINLLINRISY